MNKFLKGALCAGLCVAMLGAAGCKKSNLDPEKRQLKLATGALDGNFNPFFYTAQNDGNMISMTQISMLTTDKEGKLVCGDDWPTVAQAYTETMVNAAGAPTQNGADAVKTEYRFVIKDGIKFSDGTPLTIHDVLFNFYVYLDPAYTGSSTMYSTDIQGLKAYRAQRPNLSDSSTDSSLETGFMNAARLRINKLIEWSEDGALESTPSNAELKADYDIVTGLFRKELESDWTNVSGSWREGYKTSYRFANTWEAYYFQEGLVEVQTRQVVEEGKNKGFEQIYEDLNGNNKRDDGELYYTTLDEDKTGKLQPGERAAQNRIDEMAEATTTAKVNEYMSSHNCSQEDAYEALSRDRAIQTVYNNFTSQRNFYQILSYWATATDALNYFASDERTAYYEDIKNKNGGLLVKTISGISTEKDDGGKDVLKIVINKIDPKAIYNFSIPIAPLHYYSGTYGGKDYVAAAKVSDTEFGIEFGDSNFFRTVLQDADKNGKPVGAGAYQCTNSSDSGSVTRTNFFENNVCYFKRNDNFETVAKNINNAKIKYVNYKVYSDDKIMEALETEEIDYGSPNATNTNMTKIGNIKHLEAPTPYYTGGYGYVGINPKFVPEYKVRQAIMKAFNVNMTIGFYGSRLATTITRPMSRTSWAYPESAGVYSNEDVSYAYAGTTEKIGEIETLVREAGYTKGSDGILVKTNDRVPGMKNANRGTKLKLTFTIAGETTDHPAYAMFTEARDILNSIGFDITVQTDLQALKKMTSGNLAVWAAAWSSATDPDMYQVYHRDSTATSVNNWNYKNILTASSEWPYEYNIIDQLSKKIVEGRNSIDRNERIPVYAECLDLVMKLAVEFPTYQRSELNVYNKNVIDGGSLVQGANHYIGSFDMIWEVNYVK